MHAARRGLKARVFRRGQLAGRDSRRPGGETNSPVLYPFPYQIWFDWDVFAIGFPGASRCMHAARADETGVAPRNQQRGGRGGHAGATAGKPESSDEGIRVAPREAIRIPLGSRLLLVRVLQSCVRLDMRERHKKPPAGAGGHRVASHPGCHAMWV